MQICKSEITPIMRRVTFWHVPLPRQLLRRCSFDICPTILTYAPLQRQLFDTCPPIFPHIVNDSSLITAQITRSTKRSKFTNKHHHQIRMFQYWQSGQFSIEFRRYPRLCKSVSSTNTHIVLLYPQKNLWGGQRCHHLSYGEGSPGLQKNLGENDVVSRYDVKTTSKIDILGHFQGENTPVPWTLLIAFLVLIW